VAERTVGFSADKLSALKHESALNPTVLSAAICTGCTGFFVDFLSVRIRLKSQLLVKNNARCLRC
jgi:RNase P subunit RPR2